MSYVDTLVKKSRKQKCTPRGTWFFVKDQSTATQASAITSSASAMHAAIMFFKDRPTIMQEQFWILTLDVRKCPIAWHLITQGVLDATMVHTREVFRPAILDGADSMILMHNHPSGDATPGDVDFRTTKRLAAASVNIGIHILDHIVVGNFAVSLRETKPDIFAI